MPGRLSFLPINAVIQGGASMQGSATLSAADGQVYIGSAVLSGAGFPTVITKTVNLASFASNSATSATLVFSSTIPAHARVLGSDFRLVTACTGSATASATRVHIGTSATVAGFIASANIHSGVAAGYVMKPVGSLLYSGNYNASTAARSALVKIMVSGGAPLSSLSSLNGVAEIMYVIPR